MSAGYIPRQQCDMGQDFHLRVITRAIRERQRNPKFRPMNYIYSSFMSAKCALDRS